MVCHVKKLLRSVLLLTMLVSMAVRTSVAQDPAFIQPAMIASAPSTKKTLCNDIAAYNLQAIPPSFGPMMGDPVADPYAFYNFLTASILNPPAQAKRSRAFKILASAEQKKMDQDHSVVWPSQSLLEPSTWQDLNLLAGSRENPAAGLANVLSTGRTHTELGKAYLCGLLARPTSDVMMLSARQELIKRLVEDDILRGELDRFLKDIAANESLLTGLWDVEMLMQFIEGNYSKLDVVGPMMNETPLVLELNSLMKTGALGAAAGVVSIAPIVLAVYGLSMLFRGEPMFEKVSGYCMGMAGMVFEVCPVLKNRWLQGTVALGIGAMSSLALKQSLQGIKTIFLFDSFLRRRLVHIGMYDEAACQITATMMMQGAAATRSLTFFNDMQSFFTDQVEQDPHLAQLEGLLHTDTFEPGSQNEDQFLFSRGNMLCAYYLLNKVKGKFESLMAGLGEIDAYLTIAKLVKESAQLPTSWCFVEYESNAATPAIQLTDFWNPLLDPATVVLNSINLGIKHEIPNLMATGPNSAGKSTTLKSIALSIILAQSFGIAPARTMVLTPFSYITTYMNVADSLVDKESRFQAEAGRVFEYGDKLEELGKQNKFSFAIFDEIFSGTSPAEGASLGFKVAKIFSEYNNCISVIATHFALLTELEKETKGQFVNFKVAVEQNDDGSIHFDPTGKIVRLYKLARGVSKQHIAREVFKERGDSAHSQFFNKCFASV